MPSPSNADRRSVISAASALMPAPATSVPLDGFVLHLPLRR
ncbi:hypothetical protein V2W30_36125 [Streptomyces sp. Q6]|uniref:Uncharacterized protein n=1 Tax=Streptomyces citrinus TaxID=3118173 RepID=A0ACD5ALX5_9ACTN